MSKNRIGSGLKAWLRRDGLAIALYALVTILMTYPLFFKLGGDWLALRDADTYMKLWDNWWLQTFAFKEPSLFFTDMQFHPGGLDLSHHSISWSVAFLAWGLTLVSDAITAYNLTILIALFTTAYATYLLARPFTQYRAAAWLAGAIYGFAPYIVGHSGGHPDLVNLAPIPLAVLFLFQTFRKPSVPAGLGAALMIGLAAFNSLYIMVFALLTIGPVFLFLLLNERRWKQKEIWPAVGGFLLLSGLLLGIRLIPIFSNIGALGEAIEQKYTANVNQADVISYILPNFFNPLFSPYTRENANNYGIMNGKWSAYLGLVALALAITALTCKKQRKITWLMT